MKTITLKPLTKRLKQLIRAHGNVWRVIEEREVACFNNAAGLFIESEGHTRWVRPSDTERNDLKGI